MRTADTDAGGFDLGVGGGRTTVSLGAASLAASIEVRKKLLDVAADMLEAAPDDLVLQNGRIEIVGVKGSGATNEEISIGANGRIRQSGLETYRVPLAQDVAPVEISLCEGAPSIGPLGAKGAGEVPILNVAAAIACAVSNATGLRGKYRLLPRAFWNCSLGTIRRWICVTSLFRGGQRACGIVINWSCEDCAQYAR